MSDVREVLRGYVTKVPMLLRSPGVWCIPFDRGCFDSDLFESPATLVKRIGHSPSPTPL